MIKFYSYFSLRAGLDVRLVVAVQSDCHPIKKRLRLLVAVGVAALQPWLLPRSLNKSRQNVPGTCDCRSSMGKSGG